MDSLVGKLTFCRFVSLLTIVAHLSVVQTSLAAPEKHLTVQQLEMALSSAVKIYNKNRKIPQKLIQEMQRLVKNPVVSEQLSKELQQVSSDVKEFPEITSTKMNPHRYQISSASGKVEFYSGCKSDGVCQWQVESTIEGINSTNLEVARQKKNPTEIYNDWKRKLTSLRTSSNAFLIDRLISDAHAGWPVVLLIVAVLIAVVYGAFELMAWGEEAWVDGNLPDVWMAAVKKCSRQKRAAIALEAYHHMTWSTMRDGHISNIPDLHTEADAVQYRDLHAEAAKWLKLRTSKEERQKILDASNQIYLSMQKDGTCVLDSEEWLAKAQAAKLADPAQESLRQICDLAAKIKKECDSGVRACPTCR